MATLGPNYITGITTATSSTDVAFKEYADISGGSLPSATSNDVQKVLISDGTSSNWEYLSIKQEYESSGTFNYTVPDRVNRLLISATSGGGAGDIGELDGSKVPRATNWTQRTGSFNSYTYYYYGSITYGDSPSGNKWVNTGQSARVESSTDSIHWTTRTHGNSNNNSYWWDGTYANGEFLLVGYNYSVSASTDAIHWFARTANFGVQYNTINYGADGNYCIAGDSGRILASTDAVHWIARTGTHSSDNNWVGYLNNDWHMCGQSNNYSVSTDTIHWTKRTIPNGSSGYEINSAVYHSGEQLYVVFTQYSYYDNDNVGHGIHASTDSIHWVSRTSDFGGRSINFNWFASEYIPSIQTVVACGSYVSVVSSTDTIHWTYSKSRPEENGGDENYDIATDDDERVLITGKYQTMIRNSPLKLYGVSGGSGGGGVNALYEINGNDISKNSTLDVTVGAGGRGGGKIYSEQWTLRTTGLSSWSSQYPMVNNLKHWVSVGTASGGLISASTDSIHWAKRTAGTTATIYGVAYGDLKLAVGSTSSYFAISTDSIVWTLRTTSITRNDHIHFDGKGNWLCGYGTELVTSTDTISWSRRTIGGSIAGNIFSDGTGYFALTTAGVSYSTDSIAWTARTIGTASTPNWVSYSFSSLQYYIVGDGYLRSSTDSIVWSARTVPMTGQYYTMSTQYGQYIIGGTGLATSTDGIVWTLRTHNISTDSPRYVSYGDSKFLVSNNASTMEASILDVSAQDGEDTTISWKGKGDADLTIGGDVSVSTSVKPTGASSSYSFDGTGDYLEVSNASDMGGFTGDFSIEFWFKGGNQGGFAVFLEHYGPFVQRWAIQAEGGGTTNMIWVRDGGIKFTTSGIDALDDAWHHHAVVRDGSTITYYIDGVSRGSETFSGTLSSGTALGIGKYSSGSFHINGNLSNVRIVKGKAIYTEAFTPPTPDLQFTDHTVLLTCNGSDVSGIDAQQTYSISLPGGKSATGLTGGARVSASDIDIGYTYLPYVLKSGGDGSTNVAFGLGVDGSSSGTNSITETSYQSPGGGGAGGNALYPGAATNGYPQAVYRGQSGASFNNFNETRDGNDGGFMSPEAFGYGAYGGSAYSERQLGSFSIRTFYGSSGYSSGAIYGKYIDYLGLFVLANNTISNDKENTHLQVSTDTIHWTLRTFPFPGSISYNWTYGNILAKPIATDGSIVLVQNSNYESPGNSHTLAASTDTIHWILRTVGDLGTNGHRTSGIYYDNNTWISGYQSGQISTSTDSIHWVLRTSGFSESGYNSFAYGNGTWAASLGDSIGSGGGVITSTDTIHWVKRTTGLSTSYPVFQMIYAEPTDGENIFVTGTYKNIAWSTDAISWTTRTQPQGHYMYALNYSSVLNKYIYTDYYSSIFEFDASGPLVDLFPYNTQYNIRYGYYSIYHVETSDKINALFIAGSYYYVMSNKMDIYAGNGGNGAAGSGGGGAGIISKSTISGHGGDGGDGAVHITSI